MFGLGVLSGMAVTFRNFIASYLHARDPLHAKGDGLFTVQYPEEKLPEKERFRNFPILVHDGNPNDLRCVACDICAKECPPKCIYIVKQKDADGKPLKQPEVFDIDLAICMNCGICEEVCPFDAIFMDHTFELADTNRQESLLHDKAKLTRTWSYFKTIRPTDAAVIDDARLKKAQAGGGAPKGPEKPPAGTTPQAVPPAPPVPSA